MVVNDLLLSHNKGNMSILALLVLSSALQTVDHPILAHHHHTDFGFTDTVHQWFSFYLTDCTQYVSFLFIILFLHEYIQVFFGVQLLALYS